MALTDENGGMVMPVSPMGNNGGFGGFGNDSGWWIILLFILLGNNGWGNGFNGGSDNMQRGFDQAALTSSLASLQSSVTSGFGDVQMALCNGFAGVEQGANTRQMANMNQNFALQTAMLQGFNGIQAQQAECCCENRLAVANLGSDIAREACATRTADTQNTQSILNVINGGIQSIKDQLCQDKIDAKNDEISQLRQEVLYARGQASQIAQNSTIIDGIYNRLNQCPVGTVPVYGEQPIFTCPNNNGCGCGGNF